MARSTGAAPRTPRGTRNGPERGGRSTRGGHARPRGDKSSGAPRHVIRDNGSSRRGGTDRDPATDRTVPIAWCSGAGAPDLFDMKDSELASWHRRGVDGLVCTIGPQSYKLGGEHRFTGDLTPLSGKTYDWERYLRISNIVARADKLGMKMYLGFYFANTRNARTAARRVVRRRRGGRRPCSRRSRASPRGARALGFDGLAVDQELYPQQDGRSTADMGLELRRQHPHRGAGSVTGESPRGAGSWRRSSPGFPKVEILAYGSFFPDSWDELVQAGGQRRRTPPTATSCTSTSGTG